MRKIKENIIDFDDIEESKKEYLLNFVKMHYLSRIIDRINKSFKIGVKREIISELLNGESKIILRKSSFELICIKNKFINGEYLTEIKMKKDSEIILKDEIESMIRSHLKEFLNKIIL